MIVRVGNKPVRQCRWAGYVYHVQHRVYRVVWKRGGIRDGAELGPSERADFEYDKERGINFAKAPFS